MSKIIKVSQVSIMNLFLESKIQWKNPMCFLSRTAALFCENVSVLMLACSSSAAGPVTELSLVEVCRLYLAQLFSFNGQQ